MATTRSRRNPVETRLMTAEELLALGPDEGRGELIRGVFHPEMPTQGTHGTIEANLAWLLLNVVKPSGSGTVMVGEPGIVLERRPDTVRAPDVAYFSEERLPAGSDLGRFLDTVPDLVVEVVSPSNRPSEIREKAEMWVSFGAQLVWLVWPETMTVDVYRPGEAVVTLGADDTLTGGDVLPEFSCPVREIFG